MLFCSGSPVHPSLVYLRTLHSCKTSAPPWQEARAGDSFGQCQALVMCLFSDTKPAAPGTWGHSPKAQAVPKLLVQTQCYLLLPFRSHLAVSCTSHCSVGIYTAASSHVSIGSHLMRVTEIPWEEEFKVSQTMVWLILAWLYGFFSIYFKDCWHKSFSRALLSVISATKKCQRQNSLGSRV